MSNRIHAFPYNQQMSGRNSLALLLLPNRVSHRKLLIQLLNKWWSSHMIDGCDEARPASFMDINNLACLPAQDFRRFHSMPVVLALPKHCS